jgi:hypothetical protein
LDSSHDAKREAWTKSRHADVDEKVMEGWKDGTTDKAEKLQGGATPCIQPNQP